MRGDRPSEKADQLATVNAAFLPRLTTIITGLVTFAGEVVPPAVAVRP